MQNMKSMFGMKGDAHASSEDLDRTADRAKQTARLLEEAEENFKAELMAKNEEMTAMSAALQDMQEQLLTEKRTQSVLDDQVEEAKLEVRQREEEAEELRKRAKDLQGDITELEQSIQTVVRHGTSGASSRDGGRSGVTLERGQQGSATFNAFWLRDQEIELLRAKAEDEEQRVADLTAAARALRELILSHSATSQGSSFPAQGSSFSSPEPLPQSSLDASPDAAAKPSVWEAAAKQDRELVRELLSELRGKDDMRRQLRAT